MSKLEMMLIALSVIESIVSFVLWKRTNEARKKYEALELEYSRASALLGIWRNTI